MWRLSSARSVELRADHTERLILHQKGSTNVKRRRFHSEPQGLKGIFWVNRWLKKDLKALEEVKTYLVPKGLRLCCGGRCRWELHSGKPQSRCAPTGEWRQSYCLIFQHLQASIHPTCAGKIKSELKRSKRKPCINCFPGLTHRPVAAIFQSHDW